MRAEASKHLPACVSQEASFLYIVVFHQSQLVKLSRFQYYLDCNCMFDLFDCIEVYSCEVSLLLSQLALSGPTRKPDPTRPEPGQDPASDAHGLKSIPGGLVGS